jgi:hypothetical protein
VIKPLEILTPAFLKIALGILLILALGLLALPGCATVKELVLPTPGCRAYATEQVADYQARGWLPIGAGEAGPAAEWIVFLDPNTGTQDLWVVRLDGSAPSDAELVAQGLVRQSGCMWDGDALPPGMGPGGSYWMKSVSAQQQ